MTIVIIQNKLLQLSYNFYMNKISKFQERLKELRLENNLSQTQLSKLTGISQAAIAKWESGERTPNVECLITLALFFKCLTDLLLGLEDY